MNNQLEENGHQNESLKQQLSELKIEAEKAQELQSAGELTKHQLEVIEKENNSLMKDVSKLKDLLEVSCFSDLYLQFQILYIQLFWQVEATINI